MMRSRSLDALREESWAASMMTGHQSAMERETGGCGTCPDAAPCDGCGIAKNDPTHQRAQWAQMVASTRPGQIEFWRTATLADAFFRGMEGPQSESTRWIADTIRARQEFLSNEPSAPGSGDGEGSLVLREAPLARTQDASEDDLNNLNSSAESESVEIHSQNPNIAFNVDFGPGPRWWPLPEATEPITGIPRITPFTNCCCEAVGLDIKVALGAGASKANHKALLSATVRANWWEWDTFLPCELQWWEWVDVAYPMPRGPRMGWTPTSTWFQPTRGGSKMMNGWYAAMSGCTSPGSIFTMKDDIGYDVLAGKPATRTMYGVIRVKSGCPGGASFSRSWKVVLSAYGDSASPPFTSESLPWQPPGGTAPDLPFQGDPPGTRNGRPGDT